MKTWKVDVNLNAPPDCGISKYKATPEEQNDFARKYGSELVIYIPGISGPIQNRERGEPSCPSSHSAGTPAKKKSPKRRDR